MSVLCVFMCPSLSCPVMCQSVCHYADCILWCVGKVNMDLQLDATVTFLLISKISSTCFGQTFAHLQERKT
jgi:hypothetical protein